MGVSNSNFQVMFNGLDLDCVRWYIDYKRPLDRYGRLLPMQEFIRCLLSSYVDEHIIPELLDAEHGRGGDFVHLNPLVSRAYGLVDRLRVVRRVPQLTVSHSDVPVNDIFRHQEPLIDNDALPPHVPLGGPIRGQVKDGDA